MVTAKEAKKDNLKFKMKFSGFDGRKNYTIKKIIKHDRYCGGYKVILNETKYPASIYLVERYLNNKN